MLSSHEGRRASVHHSSASARWRRGARHSQGRAIGAAHPRSARQPPPFATAARCIFLMQASGMILPRCLREGRPRFSGVPPSCPQLLHALASIFHQTSRSRHPLAAAPERALRAQAFTQPCSTSCSGTRERSWLPCCLRWRRTAADAAGCTVAAHRTASPAQSAPAMDGIRLPAQTAFGSMRTEGTSWGRATDGRLATQCRAGRSCASRCPFSPRSTACAPSPGGTSCASSTRGKSRRC